MRVEYHVCVCVCVCVGQPFTDCISMIKDCMAICSNRIVGKNKYSSKF